MSAPDQFELLRAVVKKDVEDIVPGLVAQAMGPVQAHLARLTFDIVTARQALDEVFEFHPEIEDIYKDIQATRGEEWRIFTLPRMMLLASTDGHTPLVMLGLDDADDGVTGHLLTAPYPPPSIQALAGRTYEGKTRGDVINLAAADASKAWDEHKATTEGPRLVEG